MKRPASILRIQGQKNASLRAFFIVLGTEKVVNVVNEAAHQIQMDPEAIALADEEEAAWEADDTVPEVSFVVISRSSTAEAGTLTVMVTVKDPLGLDGNDFSSTADASGGVTSSATRNPSTLNSPKIIIETHTFVNTGTESEFVSIIAEGSDSTGKHSYSKSGFFEVPPRLTPPGEVAFLTDTGEFGEEIPVTANSFEAIIIVSGVDLSTLFPLAFELWISEMGMPGADMFPGRWLVGSGSVTQADEQCAQADVCSLPFDGPNGAACDSALFFVFDSMGNTLGFTQTPCPN